MKLSIAHNFPDVARGLAQLHADIREKALVSSINRTLDQARTAMGREIRAEFRMSASEVNAALKVKRASFRQGVLNIEGSLESPSKRGRSLNLVRFMEKSITMAAARKRMKAGEGGKYRLRGRTVTKQLELRFQIKQGGAKKVIKGAFLGNDGRTVFIREGKGRLPIRALQTIDIAQMFNTKRINERVLKTMETVFPTIFAREAAFYTDRFNRARTEPVVNIGAGGATVVYR